MEPKYLTHEQMKPIFELNCARNNHSSWPGSDFSEHPWYRYEYLDTVTIDGEEYRKYLCWTDYSHGARVTGWVLAFYTYAKEGDSFQTVGDFLRAEKLYQVDDMDPADLAEVPESETACHAYYKNFPFAMDEEEGQIIALSRDFQEKLLRSILAETGASEAQLLAWLAGETCPALESYNRDTIADILDYSDTEHALYAENRHGGCDLGWDVIDLLDHFGVGCHEVTEYPSSPWGGMPQSVQFVSERDMEEWG